jgi:4-aminobutyrate aminotransferase-like enzyme/Ser/Thr protein kinase RdoA (MazF antagonist)
MLDGKIDSAEYIQIISTMKVDYSSIKIDASEASRIAQERYGISGEIKSMPGETDFNFRIITEEASYLLKVSRPGESIEYLDFQTALLKHIKAATGIESPNTFKDLDGRSISEVIDHQGNKRSVRLLSWIEGRLWSDVNPISDNLLLNLGQKSGALADALLDFEHPFSERYLEWDIANSLWCTDKLSLFEGKEYTILSEFLARFKAIQEDFIKLRKSVVHSDVNDNNILVSDDLQSPAVKSIIDFGDAVKTQVINDVGIALAYVMMGKINPLDAAVSFLEGYNEKLQLQEVELKVLHTMIAMRLTITVTKAAMNKIAEPENEYHQISAQPAWEVLKKWIKVDESWAECHFRQACGYPAHKNYASFQSYATQASISIKDLFPSIQIERIQDVDMSVGSTWLGHEFEYDDLDLMSFRLAQLRKSSPKALIAGGYSEVRPFYTTDAYKEEGSSGPEYRTVHLGIDFWLPEETPIHAMEKGEVVSLHNNASDKDYGPTLIVKHTADTLSYFSLYGHLSESSLSRLSLGDQIDKGTCIGYIGNQIENGRWAPHLHFQLMLDLFDYQNDFPGVGFPHHQNVWKTISPDPALLFEALNSTKDHSSKQEVIDFRKEHLGKSLSLSYDDPLRMVRGAGVHLIDDTGRKYLDTVNNVAHVGHEHPRVVEAGRKQMAVLNTNTRYLHDNINQFAEELLSTFPEELSVVHFVNSGSEANELAMRMANAVTNQKDMIAVEIGYHGNTSACIAVSSYKFDGKGGKGAPEHTHIVPLPDRFRGIYPKEEAYKYAEHIQDQLDQIQSKGRNISGFICESIISCGGQIELPENYLKTAYNSVRSAGGVCISDEVQVGIGRVGSHFWGFEIHNVIPDIVTVGKPLGNGHPLAAVVCTPAVAKAFANGMEYFNTFGGNPVSCAIGTEVLRVVKDQELQKNALEVGNYLKIELEKLRDQFPIIQDIRGQGLFLGFELVDEHKNPLADHATYLANRMKELGILMSTDGKDHNAIKIKPPMVFSKVNADELLSRIKIVLKEDFIQG